ncbi:sodium-independent sulfate anion transporter [Hydra vulgaris]|uniref:sodium-independent sulfate anion transporter n=1 Tax=Hydra vulgaris TaxID=6087 RepID=UPI001F5FE48C|nr:sodium-independent sulfate anion transporter [Hydra vulgaris]
MSLLYKKLFSNISKDGIIALLKRFFPILVWLPQYNLQKLRSDLIAGFTCGVVVIPQGIAFANLAKLPPQNGLYASLTPGLIYCLFGTSKDVSTGTSVTLGLYTSRMAIVCLFATVTVYIFHVYGYNKFSIAGYTSKGLPHYKSPFQPAVKGNVTYTTQNLLDGYGASTIILPIIIFIEQISVTKAFGRKFNYKVKAQNELIAIGMMNIVASFLGGWTVGGSFTRSAVNSISGAQTPLAGVISGVVVLLSLEFMTPAFYYIPSAALGSMMLMAVITMVEMSLTINIWKLYKWGLLPFVAAFCMSFYKLEYGVMAGTGIAILIMLSREARPKYFCETDQSGKSLTLLLMENLTYPGVDAVNKTICSEVNSCAGIKTLYLDMSTMVRVDFTILKNFEFMKAELSKKEVSLEFINFSRDSIKKKFIDAGLIQIDGSLSKQEELKINVETSNLSREEISKLKYMKTGINEDDDVDNVESAVEINDIDNEIFPSTVENIPHPEF